jgi:hypothetical protein
LHTAIRFLGVDGTVSPEWTFHGFITLLHVSPDGKTLALDFPGPAGKSPLLTPHDVVIFNTADRTEVRRWSLPEAVAYSGTFASSGTVSCTLPNSNYVNYEHEVVGRGVASGVTLSKFIFPRGPVGIGAAGDKLILSHTGVTILPFRLFGTNYILTREDQYLAERQTGRPLVSWRVPRDDNAFESTVSESGEMVALGESGKIRVYRVGQ